MYKIYLTGNNSITQEKIKTGQKDKKKLLYLLCIRKKISLHKIGISSNISIHKLYKPQI